NADHRIHMNAMATQKSTQEVVFEKEERETLRYANCEIARLQELKKSVNDADTKKKVEQILGHRVALHRLRSQLDQIKKEMSASKSNVDRLAKILGTRGLQASTVERYAKRIEDEENRLDQLYSRQRELQSGVRTHEQSLNPPADEFDLMTQQKIDSLRSAPFGDSNDPFGDSNDPFGDPFGAADDLFGPPASEHQHNNM
ncbi:MAG: hypothetical protein AAGG44_14925, partial [Planctomycetota bacterium]